MWWLWLTGCVLVTPSEWDRATDRDRDGFVAEELGGDDCDDGDGAVHPDARELCGDAIDNDCDDVVDDDGLGATTWHVDADADRFGDPDGETRTACSRPEGFVDLAVSGADCDDTRPSVNPGATEICGNGFDDDCDEVVDDDGLGARAWFADLDEDGWTLGTAVSACLRPAKHDADPSADTDCNDADASVHPGATEVWYDGRDQDCDGADDYDRDGDSHRSDAHGGDDCEDGVAAAHPGATEVCNNRIDDDCDGTPNACELRGTFALADVVGLTITDSATRAQGDRLSAGDINGDGAADLLISGYGNDALVFVGPIQGTVTADAAANIVYSDTFSMTEATITGDLDGDGLCDLAIGVHNTAEVFVFISPMSVIQHVSTADAHFSAAEGSYFGAAVRTAPNNDGSSTHDLLVSASRLDAADLTAEIYAFDLRDDPETPADASAIVSYAADSLRPSFGAGHLVGSTAYDLIVPVVDAQRAYVVGGPLSDREISASSSILGDITAVAIGDVDGDGDDEIGLGTAALGGVGTGVYVLKAPASGTRTLAEADFRLEPGSAEEKVGPELAFVDLNGDGLDDLVTSIRSPAEANGQTQLVVFYAPLTSGDSAADLVIETTSDKAAVPVAVDLNNDGVEDLAASLGKTVTVVVFGRSR